MYFVAEKTVQDMALFLFSVLPFVTPFSFKRRVISHVRNTSKSKAAIEIANKLCHSKCQILCLFFFFLSFSTPVVYVEGLDLEQITDAPMIAHHRTVTGIICLQLCNGIFKKKKNLGRTVGFF